MKNLVIVFGLSFICCICQAQYYPNIASYNYNGTPSTGVKIKTNIPYTNSSQMPLITIQGYCYGKQAVIGLHLVWYVYGGNFVSYKASSFGDYVPQLQLSNEGGKVVIYINDRQYFTRFYVSAFAKGMQETASWFTGWTVARETLNGTSTVTVPYRNKFNGTVYLPENGIWANKVGIGTSTPDEKLTVKGKIHAQEVKVDLNGSIAPDFVFAPDYKLSSLAETEQYIQEEGHLPGIPSAREMEEHGFGLKDMNLKLLQKVEELTLHLIEQEKKIALVRAENAKLKALLETKLR